MAAAATATEYIDLLRKSALLRDDQVDAFAGAIPPDWSDQPKKVAEKLIHDGLLTPFQAGLILNGKWRGFLVAGGKYKLLQLLGVGGMGKVYLCEHVRMKRLVALKVLPLDQLKEPGAVERFNREAIAAAALNHPNIVKAHDIDQDGSLHFLVLEYVDGTSLHEIVKKHGPLVVPRACHYIAQAAHGLQHAHESGWIHRDVKPGNLLLDRTGTVKILDMGLARYFAPGPSNLTEQIGGTVLGTADYLSPEQAVNSSEVDIRSDVYSLGATLYFLLTGHAPFETGTVAEKLLAHQMKDPEPVGKLRPEVPAELETILKKMMAKKPVHRYQTPIAVADALAPWTVIPIEPPAAEEMPRLSAALQLYHGGSSGPGSGAGMGSSGRIVLPRRMESGSGVTIVQAEIAPAAGRRWTTLAIAGLACAGFGAIAVRLAGPRTPSAEVTPAPASLAARAREVEPTPPRAGIVALTPQAAARRVGDDVVVEFPVRSTGSTRDGSRVFLNSGRYGDVDNFTVVLDLKKLEAALRKAGIADPKEYFRSRVVRVSGRVALFKDAPQIVVSDLEQIVPVP